MDKHVALGLHVDEAVMCIINISSSINILLNTTKLKAIELAFSRMKLTSLVVLNDTEGVNEILDCTWKIELGSWRLCHLPQPFEVACGAIRSNVSDN